MRGKRQDTARVNIPLPLEVKEAVAEYAAKTNCSMSELMAKAVAEKVKAMQQAELDRQLEQAYRSMADEQRSEVAEWDAASTEAWEQAYADERKAKPRRKRTRHANPPR